MDSDFSGLKVRSFGYVFQPIVNSQFNVVGFEALARCSSKVGKNVYECSAELISLVPFEAQCNLFLSSVQSLIGHYGTSFRYAFNVEPYNCTVSNIRKFISLAKKHYVPCDVIDLEIIESSRSLLSNDALILAKSEGLNLVLDDFGVGYSNVETLLFHSFDKIKFDKVFALNHDKPLIKSLLHSVHCVVKEYDFQTVIEGVESCCSMSSVATLQADYYQGYYFGRGFGLEDMLTKQRLNISR